MTKRPPREWLSVVSNVARKSRAEVDGDRNVYLVLLRNEERDEFGVYVGMTGHTPEERYKQHKTGYKSSRAVKQYGVELIRPHFDHLEHIHYDEAARIEQEVAENLRDAGYWVEGGH